MLKRLLFALFALLLPALAAAQSVLTTPADTLFPRATAGRVYYKDWDACAGGTSPSGSDNWLSSASGTGANLTAQVPSDLNDPCSAKIDLGTVSTNDSGIRTQLAGFDLGNGEVCIVGWIRELALSTAGERFIARFGFFELDAAPTRFAGFRYTDNVNSGKWEVVARTGSVETASAVDSGITFAVNTSRWLKVCVNAGATQVDTYTSTTSPYNMTLVRSETANVPTATVGAGFVVEKTVGTTATSPAAIQFLAVEFKPTTPRW